MLNRYAPQNNGEEWVGIGVLQRFYRGSELREYSLVH